jgi:hypothetical protein
MAGTAHNGTICVQVPTRCAKRPKHKFCVRRGHNLIYKAALTIAVAIGDMQVSA